MIGTYKNHVTQRSSKATLTAQLARISIADVIEAIREARNLMNHNGLHWIQGSEKEFKHDDAGIPIHDKGGSKIIGYCAIGGLKEVRDGIDFAYYIACIELARDIDPDDFNESIDECVQGFLGWEPTQEGWDAVTEPGFIISLGQACENIVVTFNDDEHTTWAEVRSRFTGTADRLRKRDSLPNFKNYARRAAKDRIDEYAAELAEDERWNEEMANR